MKPIQRGYCDQCSNKLPDDAHVRTRFCKTCRPPYVRKTFRSLDTEGRHVCSDCSAPFAMGEHALRRYCYDCTAKRAYRSAKRTGRIQTLKGVYAVVRTALRHGLLAPVETLVCVDCGAPAKHYDHRDYNKPLDVEPVCIGCNVRRGPALPLRINTPELAKEPTV